MKITTAEVRNGPFYSQKSWVMFKADPWPRSLWWANSLQPTTTQSWLSTVFWLASSGKSMRIHRSASGLGVKNRRWWVWIYLVCHFNNHFNTFWSFVLLHVATWKTLSSSIYSSVYRTWWRRSPFSNDVLFSNHTEIESVIS